VVKVESPPPPVLPKPPPTAKLEVTSEPPGAQVLSASDLRPLGTTPWKLERPLSEGKLEVVVRLPGYHDQKLVFDGTRDDLRPVKLVAAPAPPQPGVIKKNVIYKKPWRPGKPNSPSPGTKKDDDLDVPVVR
jgi:hypothetical protein